MNNTLYKLLFCLLVAGITLYASIRQLNQLTTLRRELPPLSKEVKALQEENHRLQYEVDRFENPLHLIELARKPEYGHLKYPFNSDILILPMEAAASDEQ